MAHLNGHTFDTTSAAGTKRKRDAPKFYAVRTGHRPGIYNSWAECQAQIKGFNNAIHKSFSTRSDAESFIAAKDLATAGAVGNVKKWYAVKVGRTPGVYPNWLAIQDSISGFKGAVHKSFATKAEAEAFVNGTLQDNPAKKAKTTKAKSGKDGPTVIPDIADFAPGEAPLPEETEDGFDTAIILDETSGAARYRTQEERSKMKPQLTQPSLDAAIAIYTDGSALANGTHGAMAGVGVFFGPGDKRNVSEGLAGARQTNNRAELTAILRAIEMAPRDRRLKIYSDSNYSINCITKWYASWRRNGWHNAAGKPVENKDIIMKIIDLLDDRLKLNAHRDHDPRLDTEGPWVRGAAGVQFIWVKGHATDEGNIAADALATNGAREARELQEDLEI